MLDFTLFHRVFHADTHPLFIMAENFLIRHGYTVSMSSDTDEPDWLVAAPPADHKHNGICLVAHLDTIVRKDGVELLFEGPILRNSKGVLGADDRAGVYAILDLIQRSEHRPPIIFTNHEEVGGIGVKALCDHPELTDWLASQGVKLFVELDRANSRDYVYYSYDLPETISTWVEAYGFQEEMGSYSDVADLTRHTSIPHVNLSIGYRNQHGKNELLNVPDMLWTQAKVWHMLYDPAVPDVKLTKSEIDGPPLKNTYSPYSSYTSYTSYGKSYKPHKYGNTYTTTYDDWQQQRDARAADTTGPYVRDGFCYLCNEVRSDLHIDWYVCETCFETELDDFTSPTTPRIQLEEEEIAPHS